VRYLCWDRHCSDIINAKAHVTSKGNGNRKETRTHDTVHCSCYLRLQNKLVNDVSFLFPPVSWSDNNPATTSWNSNKVFVRSGTMLGVQRFSFGNDDVLSGYKQYTLPSFSHFIVLIHFIHSVYRYWCLFPLYKLT